MGNSLVDKCHHVRVYEVSRRSVDTLWHLGRNVPDDEEPKKLWGSVSPASWSSAPQTGRTRYGHRGKAHEPVPASKISDVYKRYRGENVPGMP